MRYGVAIACLILGACGRSGFETHPRDATDENIDGLIVDGAPSMDGAASNDGASDAPGAMGTDAAVDAPPSATGDAAVDAPPAATGLTDTYLRGSTSPNSYGTAADLRVGRDTGGNNDATLVWFDLTGHPATAVTQAKLRLYEYSSNGSGTITMDAYRLTQTWDEATATWFDASQNPTVTWTSSGGGTYASTIYASTTVSLGTTGYYEWDITAMVNQWLLGTYPNDGVELQYSTQPSISTYAQFASRENTTMAWRPQLVITP